MPANSEYFKEPLSTLFSSEAHASTLSLSGYLLRALGRKLGIGQEH
jgi:hypothetical protein